MKIPIGEIIKELMEIRKSAEEFDPAGTIPWDKTIQMKNDKGKKINVTVKLHPKRRHI